MRRNHGRTKAGHVTQRGNSSPAVDGHGFHVTCVAVDLGEAWVGGCACGLILGIAHGILMIPSTVYLLPVTFCLLH